MKTFKMFQISFARHCALLSCVPSASRSEITVKGLSNILEEILNYSTAEASEVDEVQRGKLYHDTYNSSMKVICDNVLSGNDTLLYKAVAPTNYSYDPQRFVGVTRGKYKNGIWESGDD
jgi:hypothetical protein